MQFLLLIQYMQAFPTHWIWSDVVAPNTGLHSEDSHMVLELDNVWSQLRMSLKCALTWYSY